MKPVCLPEKYEILGELGEGGMGLVYHARDVVLDREVALKMLSEQFAVDPSFVQRFLTEARAAASLNHPNIVQIYEFGQAGKSHFLAMELVRGSTLRKELKKVGRFPEARTLDIVLVACRTLAFAHRAGIVHRDVKPDNMMFTEQGDFKLVDLGLAKSMHENVSNTMTGQSLGTPHFISPEQIMGTRTIDARADIYSLGATMYNLATGSVPFDGSSGAHIMARHLNDPLPDPRFAAPELSMGFCQVLGRMMAKDPADRYQNMEELEVDLRHLRKGALPENAGPVPTALQATVFRTSPDSSLGQPAVNWDEKSLERVTRSLAGYVGPLAKVLVRKACAHAANWDELGQELAGHIRVEKDRAAFRQVCDRIGDGGGSTAFPSPSQISSAMTVPFDSGNLTVPMDSSASPAFVLDEEETNRVAGLLADRIGPVAATLVRREMKKASSLTDLVEKLARSIPDENLRRTFAQAVGPGA